LTVCVRHSLTYIIDVQDKKEHGWTGETGSTADVFSSLILDILFIRVLPSRRSIVDT
jgi:hypothetical protein